MKFRWLTGVLLMLLAACQRPPDPPSNSVVTDRPIPCTGAATPEGSVTQLIDALRHSQLELIPCRAVPPELLPPLEQAWREDRSRWPLSELPLAAKFPAMLEALNRKDAETRLRQAFNRQFAGQTRELQEAARGLGVFAVRYIQKESRYSPAQKVHHADLIVALTEWASRADLGQRDRGHQAIRLLVAGARASGIHDAAGLKESGMRGSLRHLSPLYDAAKQVTTLYGLGLDPILAGMEVKPVEVGADTALLKLQYTVDGRPVEADIHSIRRDGLWYPAAMVKGAEEALAGSVKRENGGTSRR